MITPFFINLYSNGVRFTPDEKPIKREPIVLGGCLTAKDEYFAMCDVRRPPNKHKSIR